MPEIHRAVQKLIRKLKSDPHYTIDPAISKTALLVVLRERALAVLRGQLRRPFLGRSQGVFFVGRRVQLLHARQITLGRSVTIQDDVTIDALSKQGVHLGNNVMLGRFTTIACTGVLTRLGEGFWMGDNSSLGDYSFVGAAGGVRLGNHVLVGQGVRFHSENHRYARTGIPIKQQGVRRLGIVVEDDVWLGSGVIVLDGVTIGRGAVVAAGSVITRDVPRLAVVAGNPARILRYRNEKT